MRRATASALLRTCPGESRWVRWMRIVGMDGACSYRVVGSIAKFSRRDPRTAAVLVVKKAGIDRAKVWRARRIADNLSAYGNPKAEEDEPHEGDDRKEAGREEDRNRKEDRKEEAGSEEAGSEKDCSEEDRSEEDRSEEDRSEEDRSEEA